MLINLLYQANPGLESAFGGIYVDNVLAPVPQKLAERVCRWEIIDMAKQLSEFWTATKGDDSLGKKVTVTCWSCKVVDIFTWLPCYGMYVSVPGPKYPEAVPELMAYMYITPT